MPLQVPSGQALLRMANAAKANGVKYVTGDAGYVKRLLYDGGGGGACSGAVAADGTVHAADLVVLSSGANTAALVDARDEAYAASSAICVIKLEPHEVDRYKNMPIVDDFEQGASLEGAGSSPLPSLPTPVPRRG